MTSCKKAKFKDGFRTHTDYTGSGVRTPPEVMRHTTKLKLHTKVEITWEFAWCL